MQQIASEDDLGMEGGGDQLSNRPSGPLVIDEQLLAALYSESVEVQLQASETFRRLLSKGKLESSPVSGS